MDTTFAQDGLFRLGRVFGSTNDGTCVAHGTTCRSCFARDETNNGLGSVFFDPLSSFRFELTADLSNHDNAMGIGVIHQ